MLFSIVIPVYNVEKYLDECIQSILSQVEAINNDCEILLVDDGSTDTSGHICDSYKEKYPETIKVFHNTNHGLLYTRRFGFKRAHGEYILNCDSDDVLESRTLIELRDAIRQNDYPDMILFNHYLYVNNEKKIAFKDIFTNERCCNVSKHEVLRKYMTGYSILGLTGAICKKNCIDIENDYSQFGYFNNGEDSLQKLEQFDRAETYFYLNLPLYDYRIGSGMTRKYDSNFFDSFEIVFTEIEKRKETWGLTDFEELMTAKILSTAGRAVTQSRYAGYKDRNEHIQYLRNIQQNDIFRKYIGKIKNADKYLQLDYRFLLRLLEHQKYGLIIGLLNIRNWVGKKNEQNFNN